MCKRILVFTSIVLVFIFISGCKVKKIDAQTNGFFDQIKGLWSGQLIIQNANGKTTQIPMSLTVLETASDSILTWTITYDKQTPRSYSIHAINTTKGIYEIDEQNGIKIPAFCIGNELITNYEVMGNHMTVIYDLLSPNEMTFKVNMWKNNNGQITGDTVYHGDTIPRVVTYMPMVYQVGKLKKKK
ncbi:MAG TPA: hypothetical protein PKD85_19695 [Saprospiraceae bacterium]|nr:hypothetical protein [Saprospiraceae bacterium]